MELGASTILNIDRIKTAKRKMSKQIITYVGKKSTCVGKTLWEIVGSLKGFGVGRIIQRGNYVDAYPEQTYYKILEVKAEPNEVPPKIQVFRWPNDHRDKDVSVRPYSI